MTLSEIREQFVRETGRYDLATANNTDNGANFYIRAGQRMLDRMLEFPKDQAELEVSLATGAIVSTVLNARAIQSVAVVDSQDDTIRYLERVSLREMRVSFGDEAGDLTDVDQSEPVSWALGYLRRASTPSSTTEASGMQIVTMPPADRTYTLKVGVLDQSEDLIADGDLSFWSQGHPEVLVWAAMYQLEVAYRNKEGANALRNDIRQAVTEISNDVIEQMQVDEGLLGDSHRFIEQPLRGGQRHVG